MKRHLFTRGRLYALMTTLCAASTAMADLTADQLKLLEQARVQLKRVDGSFKPALQSAGSKGKPSGAKLKLATMRLNSSKEPIPKITALLDKLPAADPAVQEFKQQFDAMNKAIEDLELRLTGKSTAENVQADAGVKLDYKPEEQLKNARFYLREIAGMDVALKELVEQVNATGDQTTFDHQRLQQGMNTITKARQRAGNVRQHLEPLPADGRGVKPAADELQQSMAGIESSGAALKPVYDTVMALINPANYPTLGADLDRLGDLAGMYANSNVLFEDPARAAALVMEASAASKERQRLVKQYAIFVTQNTETGKRLFGLNKHFVEQYYGFAAAAKERREALPGEIQAQMDEAASIAAQAVEEKKPLFFTGGIPHRLQEAETKLVLYKSLDPQGADVLQERIDRLGAQLRKQQDSLRDAIIASNELPPDRFKGDDRAAVGKLAADAWKKVHPDARVLTFRIPSEAWKRELIWRNQTGSWYKIDRSKLQVQLIVKHDDTLAAIEPINLWKNHLKGDTIKAFPLHERGEELRPQSLMSLEKVK